jgi:hypothetical protein
MLVFQNALAFNAEITAIAQASVKLSIVFERLIYEHVLNLQHNPLEQSQGCLICHSVERANEDNQIILCDRCDGYYHFDCLDPPILFPSRAEWYCPACVDERDVAFIHPLQNAVVRKPNNDPHLQPQEEGEKVEGDDLGRVVGIVRKERWKSTVHDSSPDQVVGYHLEYHIQLGFTQEELATDQGCSSRRGNERTMIWTLEEVLKNYYGCVAGEAKTGSLSFQQASSPPQLPSGYTYQLYDALGSLANGYSGWYQMQSAFPPCIDLWYSKSVYSSHINQDRLEFIRQALFPLMSRGCECQMWGEDWVDLLLAVSYKTATTPTFVDKGNAIDELSRMDYPQVLSNLEKNQPPTLSDYKTYIPVEIGEGDDDGCVVFDNDLEIKSVIEELEAETVSSVEDCDNETVERVQQNEEEAAEEEEVVGEGEDEMVTESSCPNLSEDLELQQRSIRKGYEDALFCLKLLLRSDENLVSLEGMTLQEDQLLSHEHPTGHSSCLLLHFLPGGYLHSVVKLCLPKLVDDVDITVWLSTFCDQLEQHLLDYLLRQGMTSSSSSARCAWCDQTENELCSRLIEGETFSQWEEKRRRKRSGDAMTDSPPSSSSSLSLYDPFVVHEYCSEIMNLTREKISMRKQEFFRCHEGSSLGYDLSDSVIIAEILCGLARGKVISIGSDRYQNYFYIFPGSHSVFVYRSQRNPHTGDDHVAVDDDDDGDHHYHHHHQSFSWRVYKELQEISEVLCRLDLKWKNEKSLRSTLMALYPEAAELVRLSHQRNVSHVIPVDIVTFLRQLSGIDLEKLNSIKFHFQAPNLDTPVTDLMSESDKEEDDEEGERTEGQKVVDITPPTVSDTTSVEPFHQESHPLDEKKEEEEEEGEIEWDESLDSLNVSQSLVNSRPSRKTKRPITHDIDLPPQYRTGTKVIVMKNERYYEGKILMTKPLLYKIRFVGWGGEYDSWLPESSLIPFNQTSKELLKSGDNRIPPPLSESHRKHASPSSSSERSSSPEPSETLSPSDHSDMLPPILHSLSAYQFFRLHDRHNTHHNLYPSSSTGLTSSADHEPVIPNLRYLDESDQLDEFILLKVALLMIQAALPRGCLDENEEKWGQNILSRGRGSGSTPSSSSVSFVNSWRYSVLSATTCTHLMECQLMLEYGLKASWLKSIPLKVLSCLPSRAHCLRYPTMSLLAMRVWCLDHAIKYDKVGHVTNAKQTSVSVGEAEGGEFEEQGMKTKSLKSGAKKSKSRKR